MSRREVTVQLPKGYKLCSPPRTLRSTAVHGTPHVVLEGQRIGTIPAGDWIEVVW